VALRECCSCVRGPAMAPQHPQDPRYPRITLSTLSGAGAAPYTGGMTDARRTLGQAAEDAAASFLRRAGLVVVERNVRFRQGEIDLVCRDEGVVVFVEVKCRRATWGDAPAAAGSRPKERRA